MEEEFTSLEDAKEVEAWLDAHHDEVVDAITFSGNHIKATIQLLATQPEFVDWSIERIENALMQDAWKNLDTEDGNMKLTKEALETLIAEAVQKGVESALNEGKGKPTDRSEKHDRFGKKFVKERDKKKEDKKEMKKATKISKSKLAEGVRKALRMALTEVGMPGGAMPAKGEAAGSPKSVTSEDKSE